MSQAANIHDLAAAALAGTKGGKRPGAGRKPGVKDAPGHKRKYTPRKPKDESVNADIDDLLGPARGTIDPEMEGGEAGAATRYADSRANKEAALAGLAELRLRVQSGLYLPKEAFEHGTAVAHQTVAQALRSIPDNLERKLGISPEVSLAIGQAIEDALGDLSTTMEALFNQQVAALQSAETTGGRL